MTPMAIDVKPEIVIHRPRAVVAAYMFDPRHDAEWTTGVISVRPLTDGPLRAGARVERTVKFLGRRFGYQYECVDAAPERFVELRVEQPFPMQVRYQLDDVPDGTLASIRARGEASGFFRVAAPLLSRMVRRNITRDLEQLKQILER